MRRQYDEEKLVSRNAIQETMRQITALSTSPQSTENLAALYASLSAQMVSDGRLDEAVTALLAASEHAVGAKKIEYANAAAIISAQVGDPEGILQEHRSYMSARGHYDRYPAFVRIETLTSCNASCIFCPYPGLERKGKRMPDALVEKILDDLTDMPREHQFGLSFHHMSEPLIDKRFRDLVAWSATHLPNCRIIVNTNGSALNESNIEFLGKSSNIGEINVSFNDHRPDAYRYAMRLPYDRIVKNIDLLHRAHVQGLLKTKVVIRRVGDASAADDAFVDFCRSRWPRFMSVSKLVKDFLGQIETGPSGAPIQSLSYAEVPVSGCHQWYQMTITSEGKLAVCCFDGKAEWPIGDVTEKHVLDVYNSEAIRRFRSRSNTRLEAPAPCNTCTIFWGGRKMNPAKFIPQATAGP